VAAREGGLWRSRNSNIVDMVLSSGTCTGRTADIQRQHVHHQDAGYRERGPIALTGQANQSSSSRLELSARSDAVDDAHLFYNDDKFIYRTVYSAALPRSSWPSADCSCRHGLGRARICTSAIGQVVKKILGTRWWRRREVRFLGLATPSRRSPSIRKVYFADTAGYVVQISK